VWKSQQQFLSEGIEIGQIYLSGLLRATQQDCINSVAAALTYILPIGTWFQRPTFVDALAWLGVSKTPSTCLSASFCGSQQLLQVMFGFLQPTSLSYSVLP
jgi:hypothetical protein